MYDFTFKGINSRDLRITVNRRPPRESANTRSTITEIDGVDGGYIEKVGLNTYVMEFDMTVEGLHNVEIITGWLQGQGEFRRSDVPGKALWVEHQAPIEFQYLTDDLYTCTTTFYVVDPTWYLVEDDWHEPWGANLIPNGWDSFTPYGSGKNFVDNWDFRGDDLSQFRGWSTQFSVKDNMLYIYETGDYGDANAGFSGILPKGIYKVRYKVKAPFGVREWQWVNTSVESENIARPSSEEFVVYEREFEVIDDTKPIRVSFFPTNGHAGTPHKGNYLYIDWIQITPVDNQHLVVEKTPLGNGLTRIQTWGGNQYIKLWADGLPNGDTTLNYSTSVNVSNTGKFPVVYFSQLEGLNVNDLTINPKETTFVNYTGRGKRYNLAPQFRAKSDRDSLDFTASVPVIVEGDKPATWDADSNPRIVNEGNYKSLPIIKLEYGTSKYVDVLVNKTRFVYEFKDNDKFVIIDCENQTAVDEQGRNRIRNLKIGYEFPTLRPGANTVKIIDGDAKISFRRKDRWR